MRRRIITITLILSGLFFQNCGQDNVKNTTVHKKIVPSKSQYQKLIDKINNDVTFARQTDNSGQVILHNLGSRNYTLKYSKSEIVNIAKAVLNKGIPVDVTGNHNYTPLWAVMVDTDSGNYDYNNEDVTYSLAKLYLDMGANVNHTISNGRSVLHSACYKGHPKAVEMLIKRGADINIQTKKEGWTPLHSVIIDCNSKSVHTSREKQIECIRILIDRGANINKSAYSNEKGFGHTPLTLAVSTGQKDIVKLLLTKNANVNATEKNGNTPCDYAVSRGYDDILELLRLYGGKRRNE